jgi:hypothetical protein
VADVQQIARYKLSASARNLVPRELRRLERILHPDEQLVNLAQGRFEDGIGLIAATDRRLIFLGRQLVIEERTFRAQGVEFSYASITLTAQERQLSGQLVVQEGRRKMLLSEITPKERASEIADYAGQRIVEERKTKRAAVRKAQTAGGSALPLPAMLA